MEKSTKKVLLTGATGFIGRNVANDLLELGYEVYALANSTKLPESDNLIQVKLDLFDTVAVEKFLKDQKFENLIHLAWYTGPKCHSTETNLDWTIMSMQLLKNFQENGGKKVLMVGSVSEYDFSHGYLKEDLTPLTNPSFYGKCKSSLYKIASAYAKKMDMDFKWARIFNLYGPHEKEARLMSSVIISMLKGEDVKVSTCEKIQDYTHVYDTASGIVNLFESDVQGAVNICSGKPVLIRDIVEKIKELLDFKGKILYGAIPTTFEDNFVVGCNERLTNEVGFKPKYSLEDGLKQTISWWRKNLNV